MIALWDAYVESVPCIGAALCLISVWIVYDERRQEAKAPLRPSAKAPDVLLKAPDATLDACWTQATRTVQNRYGMVVVPGDIVPDLRRRGSPVASERDGLTGTVVDTDMGFRVYSPTEGDGDLHELSAVWGLDLTEATGRAHAQHRVRAHWTTQPPQVIEAMDREDRNAAWAVVCHDPFDDAWWSPAYIAMLREVVLRLVGRWL